MKNKEYTYAIFRPGGNDTCLVYTPGVFPSLKERKVLNNFIQQTYPTVEQVGFFQTEGSVPRLLMAGGEFCGNAVRSFAYLVLKKKPGNVLIQVISIRKYLKAGVTNIGEAFSQMPIYDSPSKISSYGKDRYLVQMKGITHYIIFSKKMKKVSSDQLKQEARELIREKGLGAYPAAGVIYATISPKGISIHPVVYVKALNTLYYETACGSGTTAVGLVLALKKKGNIENVSVLQSSGMSISVSVIFNKNKNIFAYAQIQGEVQELVKGKMLVQNNKIAILKDNE